MRCQQHSSPQSPPLREPEPRSLAKSQPRKLLHCPAMWPYQRATMTPVNNVRGLCCPSTPGIARQPVAWHLHDMHHLDHAPTSRSRPEPNVRRFTCKLHCSQTALFIGVLASCIVAKPHCPPACFQAALSIAIAVNGQSSFVIRPTSTPLAPPSVHPPCPRDPRAQRPCLTGRESTRYTRDNTPNTTSRLHSIPAIEVPALCAAVVSCLQPVPFQCARSQTVRNHKSPRGHHPHIVRLSDSRSLYNGNTLVPSAPDYRLPGPWTPLLPIFCILFNQETGRGQSPPPHGCW